MTLRILAPALLLTLATTSGPAGAERLGLAEAMARARERAHEVAAARALADAGAARLRQAKSHRLPSIRLEEIWLRTDSPADVFGLQLNQERFSFADFVAGDPNDPDPLENALTRLELSLPLYTGGEIGGRIRQARLAAEAAGERAQRTGDEAALAAAEAYILLVQARERVALLERSLATVQAHVRLAGAFVEQGMLVRSELLRAEVEEARLADLLAAGRGHERVAEANLGFRLADAAPVETELEPLAAPAPLEEGLEAWLAGAESRGDLTAARRLLEAGQLEERVRRAALRPRVGLAARYDLNDDVLFGSHGDATAFIAVAGIDLFSGGRHRAAAAAARAEAEAAAAEVARFAAAVQLEVRDAWERSVSARERHQTALAALAAARETERITEERFRQGVVKTLDLLDAATAHREAETRELVARAEAHLETLRLAVAAGRAPESALP